jgi:hypothetical protein
LDAAIDENALSEATFIVSQVRSKVATKVLSVI